MRRAEITDRLQQAIALAQAGQHAEARRLLEEVVAADPGSSPDGLASIAPTATSACAAWRASWRWSG